MNRFLITPPLETTSDNAFDPTFLIIIIVVAVLVLCFVFLPLIFRRKSKIAQNDQTEVKDQKVKTRRKLFKYIFLIIVIGVFIFGIIQVVSCVKNNNSDIITQNGIKYQKITYNKDGISVDAYEVVGCDADITNLTIPNKINNLSVLSIQKEAFLNNLNLREINIPDSITSIYLCSAPFRGCNNIEKVTMASSDVMLLFTDYGGGDNNLDHTVPSSLHYVYISEGCTKINYRDFYYCSNIEEIHIPNSVTTIEDGTNLTSIGVNGNSTTNSKFGNLPFVGCTNLKIYCAASSKPSGWGTYWNYIDEFNQAEVVWGTY